MKNKNPKAPKNWEAKEIYTVKERLNFGRYKNQLIDSVPADYLIFLHENGWIILSDQLLKQCQEELKENGL